MCKVANCLTSLVPEDMRISCRFSCSSPLPFSWTDIINGLDQLSNDRQFTDPLRTMSLHIQEVISLPTEVDVESISPMPIFSLSMSGRVL